MGIGHWYGDGNDNGMQAGCLRSQDGNGKGRNTMTRSEEVQAKLTMTREFMTERDLDAVALSTRANFAWLTAGGMNHVGLGSAVGVGTVVVTADRQYLLTSNIEAGRIEDEETGELPFEIHFRQWDEQDPAEMLAAVTGGRVGSDSGHAGASEDIADDFARLRRQLVEPEVARYREVGRIASEAIAATCREIEPGMTEHEIAGRLMGRAFAVGCQPTVALIAADERALKYRHPIPSNHVLREWGMVVLGCSKWGLGISATRMVSFGEPDAEMRDKHAACCLVAACLNLETRPGVAVSEVFAKAVAVYADTGHAEQWRLHHQGGATGYAAREYFGSLDCGETALENQAFAWNPSITGTKSEDTIIVTGDGPEFLSTGADWPTLDVEYEGATIERMDILVR